MNRSTRLLEALSSNQKLLYPEEPLGGGKLGFALVQLVLAVLHLLVIVLYCFLVSHTFWGSMAKDDASENSYRNAVKGTTQESHLKVPSEQTSTRCEFPIYKETAKDSKDKKQSVEFDTNDDQPCSLDLSGYTLVRGIKTGHTFDTTVPLVDWMNAVRRSIEEPETRPNSTFYFPEERAGPDLMFALHKNPPEGGDEVVLCVLQVSESIITIDQVY